MATRWPLRLALGALVLVSGCTSGGSLMYDDAAWRADGDVAPAGGEVAFHRDRFIVPRGVQSLRVDVWVESEADGSAFLDGPGVDRMWMPLHLGTRERLEPWVTVDSPDWGSWSFGVGGDGRVRYIVGVYYERPSS